MDHERRTAAQPASGRPRAGLIAAAAAAMLIGSLVVATAQLPERPASAGVRAAGAADGSPAPVSLVAAASTRTVVAAGDIACPVGSPVTAGTCQQRATAARVLAADPDDVLALGDLVYPAGTRAAFMGSYDPTWGRFKARTHPVIGNHEYNHPAGGAKGYFDYWNGAGAAGGKAGQRGKGWYSYDLGAWHVVVLNSECGRGGVAGGCGPGSPQYTWLKTDLAGHRNVCTLAAFHRPRFTTGEHASDTMVGHLWNLMVTAGVDVALNGHNHSTEIFEPIGVTPVASTQPVMSPTGIREIVAGNGGKELGRFQAFGRLGGGLQRALVARSNTAHGVLQLTLRPASYSWRMLPIPGMTFRNAPGTTASFSGAATCR